MLRDDIVDVIVLLFLTSFLLTMGYTKILKEYKVTSQYSAEILEQKNLQEVEGVKLPAFGDYSGTLTAGQVVLMSQVQDWYMPKPKLIKVYNSNGDTVLPEDGGKGLEITETIDAQKQYYAKVMLSMLKNVNADQNTKFSLSYDNGDDYSTHEDDFWIVEEIVNIND